MVLQLVDHLELMESSEIVVAVHIELFHLDEDLAEIAMFFKEEE